MNRKLFVDKDISIARTLPSFFYNEPELFEESKEKIFKRCWQLAGDLSSVKIPGQVTPLILGDEFLGEPVLLTRDHNDRINCLSNVCTHRGNLIAEGAGIERNLRCRYHGRKFELDGRFISMPEFDGVAGFPSEEDNLPHIPFDVWQTFIFASLRPIAPLMNFTDEMNGRVSFFDFNLLKLEPSRSRDYLVKCHWALYCENYLEGFHIPFVHNSLSEQLDYTSYVTEIYPFSNLQLGVGKSGEFSFDIPAEHPDAGRNISAYYYWVFPNMMFNFYPWGLSINIVKPIRTDLTKVSFLTYILDDSKLGSGAGAELDKVEREDEAIVESVQKGMRSSNYVSGRYSPRREQGVHQFHRLICDFMNQ